MHKPTIITVAILSMMSQIDAMEEKQAPTETTTEETVEITQQAEQPVETSSTKGAEDKVEKPTAQQIPMIPAPSNQADKEESKDEDFETTLSQENIEQPAEEEQITVTTESAATPADSSLTKTMTEMPAPVDEEPIVIPEE